jgi:hypothetical protein
LKDAGLVRGRREGRETHYSAKLGALASLIDWTSQMTGFWQSRFAQLEDLLKRMDPMNAPEKPAPRPATDGEVGTASQRIDARIKFLGDWRGETLARVRAIIKEADPGVIETWKWRGVPVWEHDGIICTGETYKAVVKLTFAKGASLDDPSGLFNSSLDGNTRRAIDLREGDKIDAKALKALVRAAVALNTSNTAKRTRPGNN